MTPVELRALIDARVASDPEFAALVEARQAGDVTKDRAIAEALSVAASATGTATFYRIYNTAGTTCFEQGTVATSGADMTIDNASITSGQTVNITAFSKTAPG